MPRRRPPIYTVLLGPLPEMDDLREGHDQIWPGDVLVDRSFVLGVDAAGRTVLVLTASAN